MENNLSGLDVYRGDKPSAKSVASVLEDLYIALEVAVEPCARGEICPVCDEQPHRDNCMAESALRNAAEIVAFYRQHHPEAKS